MANTAPTGGDNRITVKEGGTHTFTASDFPFQDLDGDNFAGILIDVVSNGKLLLDGSKVADGQLISAEQISQLTWSYGDNSGRGQAFLYTVLDDSETNNVSSRYYNLYFTIKDEVDTFKGTSKGEKIVGTQGADYIDPKGGNDKLVGNGGKDVFVFSTGYDRDIILDPVMDGSRAQTIIDLSGLDSVTDFKDLIKNHVTDGRNQLVINGGDGDVLILKGVGLDDLDRGDFMF